MKKLILNFVLGLIYISCHAQKESLNRNSFFSIGMPQIKESANFGIVFRGTELNYGMSWFTQNEKRFLRLKYELGANVIFAKNIPGLGIYFKPVDFVYLFKLPGEGKNLFLGPLVKMEYNYNLYPDLQSAFDYWFSNFSLGASAHYNISYKKTSIQINLNTSLLGFVSRQPEYRDPYYYDIGFSHAVKHLNQGFEFGSFNMYNTTQFEILFKMKQESRFTFGYDFNYSGYYKSPEIKMISQNIKLIVSKKQK